MDTLHVWNLTAPISAPAARFAHLVVVAQTGNQLAFEFAARMQIDGVVDGFVRDALFGFVGPHGFQFACDLLWRPLHIQVVTHHLEQGPGRVQLGDAAGCNTPRLTLLMRQIGIVTISIADAFEFPADRAGRTTKAFGNGTDGTQVTFHAHDDGAFLCG